MFWSILNREAGCYKSVLFHTLKLQGQFSNAKFLWCIKSWLKIPTQCFSENGSIKDFFSGLSVKRRDQDCFWIKLLGRNWTFTVPYDRFKAFLFKPWEQSQRFVRQILICYKAWSNGFMFHMCSCSKTFSFFPILSICFMLLQSNQFKYIC